jgi:tRNA A-37 threonylcarbamoyl transferase component Bud32
MPGLAVVEKAGRVSASPRIYRTEIAGRAAWVKDFDQPSPAKWAGVLRIAFLVLRLGLLRPVPTVAGVAGAEAELAAMRRFREAGARVPDILWVDGARFAMTDIGVTLRDAERRAESAGEIAAAVERVAHELARLHAGGLVHGRPILRNLTWDGDAVGFLDFEENPSLVMRSDAAQARDVLLFLSSVGRRNGDAVVRNAFAAYAALMQPAVRRELSRVALIGRPLAGRLGGFVARRGGRDALGLVRAVAAIQALRPRRG